MFIVIIGGTLGLPGSGSDHLVNACPDCGTGARSITLGIPA
jgi:hypothetical protein